MAAAAVALPLLIWLERKMSSPDAAAELRMRAAKAAERLAATVAARAWQVAEAARRAYERDTG